MLNEDGQYSEVEVSEIRPHYIRAIFKGIDFAMGPLESFPSQDAVVVFEYYTIEDLAFRMGNKIAKVSIYVSDNFMSYINPVSRKAAIKNQLREDAPWLFTYGTRNEI